MNRHIRNTVLGSLLAFVIFAPPAYTAAEATPPGVDVPATCAVSDTGGAPHEYSGAYFGVCALIAAKDAGMVSAYTFQDFSFGLFLASLNGTAPGATEYWALYHNGSEASVGLTDLVVAKDDTIKLQLKDWMSNSLVGSPVEFSIRSLITQTNSSGTKPEFLKEKPFNVKKALEFLVQEQRPDGSFGSSILTDWAAIAFAAVLHDATLCESACRDSYERLRAHLQTTSPVLSSVTDYERHAMALLALNINPYAGTETDYITPIAEAFDGEQIGEVTLVNDDIFALFPLLHTGYTHDDLVPQAILVFILPRQKADGSWEGSVDLTAAAVQALAIFPETPEISAALERAKTFLRRNQNESGIFGHNSFSLSWALQTIAALGDTPEDWRKSGLSPLGYLGIFQQEDGGVEPMSVGADTRVWATSYAIPAALGSTWDSLLMSFEKPTLSILSPTQEAALAERTVSIPDNAVPAKEPPTMTREAAEGSTTTVAQTAVASSAVDGNAALSAALLAGLILGLALLFWSELRKLLL